MAIGADVEPTIRECEQAGWLEFWERHDPHGQVLRFYYVRPGILTATVQIEQAPKGNGKPSEAKQGEGEKPGADPFAELRQFARDQLRGQERAVIEALCDAAGELSIADLALKEGVGWTDSFQGFKDAQRRLKNKLKRQGWRMKRQNNAGFLVKL